MGPIAASRGGVEEGRDEGRCALRVVGGGEGRGAAVGAEDSAASEGAKADDPR